MTIELDERAGRFAGDENKPPRIDALVVFDSPTAGIAELRPDASFVAVNDRFCEITGRSRDELLGGMTCFGLTHPDDLPKTRACIEGLLRGDASFVIEERYRRPDGSIVWVHHSASAVRGEDGELSAAIAIVLDVTAQRRREALQAAQCEVLEHLATGASLPAVLATLVRVIEEQAEDLLASVLVRHAERDEFYLGVAPSIGAPYIDVLATASLSEPYLGPCAQAVVEDIDVITPDIPRDAVWSPLWRKLATAQGLRTCSSWPIRGSDGRVLGSFATYDRELRDAQPPDEELIRPAIHIAGIAIERTRAEEALRASEARLAAELADAEQLQAISSKLLRGESIDALCEDLVDAAMTLMRSDCGSMQVLRPDQPVLELLVWRNFHPASAAFWRHVDAASGSSCGEALERGERIIVPNVEEAAFMAGTEDLVEYRRSAIRAVQSTPLTARTGEVLGMISTHWRQPHAPSERELRLFDLIARQAADLLQHRNSAELVRESAERARLVIDAAQLGTWTYNLESGFVTLDERMCAIWGEPPTRSVLPFEAMLNGVNADHREAVAVAVASAINGDSTALHEMEIRLADAAGGERWVAMSGRAVFDIRSEESRAMKFLGTAIDVTNAKRAEAELLRALAAKDDFLSLVSHELRTPITTILGNADVLLRHGDVLSADTREDSLRDIRHDARRLNRTVDDLLTVARAERGALEPEPVALSRALHNIVGDYERETNSRIALEVDDPSCIVLAERGVLGQILRNYLSNAEKYGLGKPLQVTLECTPREALVRVLDRGIGVDPEEADRLFDVFYRSKDAGPIGGMGIGLAVCRRLAEAVGGRVWAARREGGGSEFGLALALCDDAPDDAAE